ncbi:hypothetical protein FDECE_12233 [Fusarium decemcellulare]|nr:hypothetical protein FDECE_12233 [Fusarium decemcellulare]
MDSLPEPPQPDIPPSSEEQPPLQDDKEQSKHDHVPPQASSPPSTQPPTPPPQPPPAGVTEAKLTPPLFPPSFNIYREYRPFSWTTYKHTLGEHEDRPLCRFAFHGPTCMSPSLVLHSSPQTNSPVLASVREHIFTKSFDVKIPSVCGSKASATRVSVESITRRRSGMLLFRTAYRFRMGVGSHQDDSGEAFEWQRSRSDAVDSLGGERFD